MNLNNRLLSIEESATVALADRVRKLKASGKSIIALQTGDPDFVTPDCIIEAAHEAMRSGQTHYCDSRGLPELRRAIAERIAQQSGVHYDPDAEILVTCGGIHAYYCALQAVVNPGDEVMVPDPAWMPHSNMVSLVGGKAVRVPSTAATHFFPTMDAWQEALTSRTVALVINSPNNPTGMVAERKYLEHLVQFAAANDLFVISDEVYDGILFDGREHICVASLPDAKSRTLLVNSLSKTYAMTGWRVGYLAAPGSIIEQALKASQFSITSLAPFVQSAASFALRDNLSLSASAQMAMRYESRKNLVMKLWQDSPVNDVQLVEPFGAFYFFIDIRNLGIKSEQAAISLLEDHSVALVPASVYGQCGEGFLRMTIAASDFDVEEGFLRLLAWADKRRSLMKPGDCK